MNLREAFLSVIFRSGLIAFFGKDLLAEAFAVEFIRQNQKILDLFD